MELISNFTDPNVGAYSGETRLMHVPFAASTVFKRRGGKAVVLNHRYEAATAVASNLAGFAEVEEVGTANGRPTSTADGDLLPVNMGLQATAVFPTTGRVATMADKGKDFDIYVDANGVQMVNLSNTSKKVLRVSQLVTVGGEYVACSIPPTMRYGDI